MMNMTEEKAVKNLEGKEMIMKGEKKEEVAILENLGTEKVDHLGELERPGAVEVEKDMILTENMKKGDGRDTAQAHEGI